MQVELFNNSQLLNYPLIGSHIFPNLQGGQDRVSVFTVKGNYTGLSFTISPKKGWIKRKVQKNAPKK